MNETKVVIGEVICYITVENLSAVIWYKIDKLYMRKK